MENLFVKLKLCLSRSSVDFGLQPVEMITLSEVFSILLVMCHHMPPNQPEALSERDDYICSPLVGQ